MTDVFYGQNSNHVPLRHPVVVLFHDNTESQYPLCSLIVVSFLQVFDQYLNFISLEEDMFSLRPKETDSASYYGKAAI